jgi:Leucine-rich repeat (LRR) protein
MNLESLTELDLSNNCLTSVQMHWVLAPSLRNLKMNGNHLVDAQSWNGAGQETPHARLLEFHDNCFKLIPMQVFMFLEVTDLDISMNSINKLPITIKMLTELTSLRVSSTNLSTMPAELSTLYVSIVYPVNCHDLLTIFQEKVDLSECLKQQLFENS